MKTFKDVINQVPDFKESDYNHNIFLVVITDHVYDNDFVSVNVVKRTIHRRNIQYVLAGCHCSNQYVHRLTTWSDQNCSPTIINLLRSWQDTNISNRSLEFFILENLVELQTMLKKYISDSEDAKLLEVDIMHATNVIFQG